MPGGFGVPLHWDTQMPRETRLRGLYPAGLHNPGARRALRGKYVWGGGGGAPQQGGRTPAVWGTQKGGREAKRLHNACRLGIPMLGRRGGPKVLANWDYAGPQRGGGVLGLPEPGFP